MLSPQKKVSPPKHQQRRGARRACRLSGGGGMESFMPLTPGGRSLANLLVVLFLLFIVY